jgi:hypothetical protein
MSVTPTDAAAPPALTMDRMGEKKELIVAQSTSQCFRGCCFQPSINWVLNESHDFTPGTNPYDLPSSGWVHEESSFCERTWSGCCPGFRAVKYVHHSGSPPESLTQENGKWCHCQKGDTPEALSGKELEMDVIATHEKDTTCGPCCFVPTPYLETKIGDKTIGKTVYVCDGFIFVPKFDVLDANGDKRYHLRPDTCVAGQCVMCRCGGGGGKCFRVPFILRDPTTKKPLPSETKETTAQVTNLWSGWANECCMLKNAYHVAFPTGATPEDKMTLIGSSILVDMVMFEHQDDNN